MSQDQNHLNHATWECKYHVVFTPKDRKKLLFGQIRRHLGTVFPVGRDEEMIRAYIRNQEMADKQLDQLQLKLASS